MLGAHLNLIADLIVAGGLLATRGYHAFVSFFLVYLLDWFLWCWLLGGLLFVSTNRREGKRMSRCRRCSTSAQLETLPQQKTNARRFDDVCPVDIFRFFRVEHSPETNEFVGIVATTMKKERVDRWGVPKIWDSLAGRRGHRQSNKPHFFGAEPNARARSRIEVFWVPFLTENVQRTASFVWSVTSGLRNTVRRHITQKTPQQYTVRSARGPLHFVFSILPMASYVH